MGIPASMVKELREKTGMGVMECKKALEEADGDMEKAIEILKRKGIAKAEKKKGRVAKEGLIVSYIHPGNRLGVLLEVNCETDFVAKTSEFAQLAKDLAMQVAAANPIYISREDVPDEVLEKEKEFYKEEAKKAGKPEKIIEKIVEGKLEKNFFREKCLLDQPFIKDENITIKELISNYIAKLGENIVVRRFARFKLGE